MPSGRCAPASRWSRRCAARRRATPLEVRIGIATGLVVVGDLVGEGPAQEQAVVGETPNLAARLQALAEPGAVVVAAATRRLVGNLFRLQALGRHEVKGLSEPVKAWAVEGVSASEGRFEAVRSERLTGFVGREHELGLLLERWNLAQDGEGQVVLLSGEPGIGKSRILSELRARREAENAISLRLHCSPYYVNSAFYPIIDRSRIATVLITVNWPFPTNFPTMESLGSMGPRSRPDLPSAPAVYAIENVAEDKVYVGSSLDTCRRVEHHRYILRSEQAPQRLPATRLR